MIIYECSEESYERWLCVVRSTRLDTVLARTYLQLRYIPTYLLYYMYLLIHNIHTSNQWAFS